MNKKKGGSLEDIAFLVIFLAVLAIFAYPVTESLLSINDEIQQIDSLNNQSKNISQESVERFPAIIEGIYLMLLLVGYVGTFILANRIDTHMPFFIIAIIFFTAMILVVPILANAWDDTVGPGSGMFTTAQSQFTIIPFIMQHYLKIMLGAWFLVGFSIYAGRGRR